MSPGGVSGFDPQRLRLARNKAGLSYRQVGESAGISATTVFKYEKGQSRPRAHTLRALATALDCTTAYLAPAPRRATLTQLRDAAGLSLRDIALVVGFTKNTVSRVEQGHQWPDDVQMWAAAYGLTLKQFAEAWRRS